MTEKINSAALFGIDAIPISVEVDAQPGLPNETIVGLPDAVIKESRNRVKSAIRNSGLKYPQKNFTINLAPAEVKKEGPFFDLPIALGILAETQQIDPPEDACFVGELSLDGDIRPIRGALSIADMARKQGKKFLFLPEANAAEASLVEGIHIVAVKQLKQIIRMLNGQEDIHHKANDLELTRWPIADFCDVKGQDQAKRALEIAAVGQHNVLFIGPPGSGKTMLMKRFLGILPDLSIEEALTTFKIQSISTRNPQRQFSLQRPFRSPHHTTSYSGMVGGGSNPSPGEISLANHGVLFLDELAEFPRQVIDVLRQPMEDHSITISRANASITYPATFTLLAAMNPCPCGYHGDPKIKCHCQDAQITKYWKKVSGPILDRIDIILEVPRLTEADITGSRDRQSEASSEILKRVHQARNYQQNRKQSKTCNANLDSQTLKAHCALDQKTEQFLAKLVDRGKLTGRSFDKVLRVARSIADLDQSETIQFHHVSEAIQYRRHLFNTMS